MYRKQATMLMALLGTVYLMIFYLMGLYFGYYEATNDSTLENVNNVYDNNLMEL